METTLTLQLTLPEVNTILSALGGQPYVQVYELVQKIQAQAGAQVERDGAETIEKEEG